MGDCSKTGTIMPLLNNNNRAGAVAFIMAWTNCSNEEAENAVDNLIDSSMFKNYVEEVRKNEEAILELKRKEANALTTHLMFSSTQKQRSSSVHKTNEYFSQTSKANQQRNKKNTMVFIDAESVAANRCSNIIGQIRSVGEVAEIRYYARQKDPSTAAWKEEAKKYGIKAILMYGEPGPNKIDDKIVRDIYHILETNKSIDVFCIASRDGDFSGIVQDLRETYHKKVIVLATKNTSGLLKSWASEIKGI